ncbi:Hsp70 family protein [Rhodococcus sp. SJ-3]|uniref:Hsp70 family protein n=1 Tax=Rhodococcus sp. SJ-3 TaxID=3454628 RepID=UPI003F7A94B5
MSIGQWSLAIDFGTSNTAAAVTDARTGIHTLSLTHQSNLMVSSVFVRSVPVRSLGDILVGDAAVNAADSDPGAFVPSPKRLVSLPAVSVRGTPVPRAALFAAVIGTVYHRALRHSNSVPPSRVVLTHPEGWSADVVAVLTDAAAQAGIDPSTVVTVSEPRAAAHFYSRSTPVRAGSAIAVFDFGGGTVDVAILRSTPDAEFEVVTAIGDNGLGGKNFDALVRNWAESQLADLNPELAEYLRGSGPDQLQARRALEESARRAKEVLSDAPSATVSAAGGPWRENLLLTRGEFEDLIAPQIEQATALVRAALTQGRVPHDQLQAIYLTGGSSRIPLVHSLLGQVGPVATLDDPKTVVARGALAATGRSGRPAAAPTVPVRAPRRAETSNRNRISGRALTALGAVVAVIAAAVGVAVYWPDSDDGEGAVASGGSASTPAQNDVFTVSAGGWFTCADSRGDVSCWGLNASGQLGDGTTDSRYSPVPVELPSPASALGTGREHACAALDDGTTYCWGYNTFGQLGVGTTDPSTEPVRIDMPASVTALSAGEDHTCALTDGGEGYCWGRNTNGQAGEEGTELIESPRRIDLPTMTSLAAGGNHTCASTVVGDVFCWGANTSGQLGRGYTNDSDVAIADPLQVKLPAAATFVVAGRGHTCAALEDDRTYCWGENGWGQLGDGTTDSRSEPVQASLSGAVALAASLRHTCAVTDDGAVSCWGTTDWGQHTSAPGSVSTEATSVTLPAAATTLTTGAVHTCATTVDEQVFCWGENGNGELGNESTTASAVPVRVPV